MKSPNYLQAQRPEVQGKRAHVKTFRRRGTQRGFTIVETMVVLVAVAVALIFIVQGGLFLRNHVRAYQLTNETQASSQGILSATVNDATFATVTTAAMINNNAFASVGSRVNTTSGTVTGIWGGDILLAPATLNTSDDAVDETYPNVPAGVCPLAVQTLTSTYQQISVNGTVVFSPTVPLTDAAVGSACAASTTDSLDLFLTRTS